MSSQAYIGFIVLIVLIAAIALLRYNRNVIDGYEDYTSEYNDQLDKALQKEEFIKMYVEMAAKEIGVEVSWTTGDKVDNTKLSDRVNALPTDPNEYLTVLIKMNKKTDARLIDTGVPKSEIDKINAMQMSEVPKEILESTKKYKEDIMKAYAAITLDSLKKIKARGDALMKMGDDIILNGMKIFKKFELNAKLNKAPETFEEYVTYEVKKFTKPTLTVLKFTVDRLAKVLSLGDDGKPKYSPEVSEELALKELSEQTKITDLAEFYKYMKPREEDLEKVEHPDKIMQKVFSEPKSYVSFLKYVTAKFAAMQKTTETFMDLNDIDMLEGFIEASKCVPCKIEPEVKDLTAVKNRYSLLQEIYPEFRELNIKAGEMMKASAELERKAKSGELMNEMLTKKKK